MVNSQENNYQIGVTGLGKIVLNSDAKKAEYLEAIRREDNNEFIFRPSEDMYASFDVVKINNYEIPFIYKKIFCAKDSLNSIKKIFLYVEGNTDKIVRYLDHRFKTDHVEMKSFKDNTAPRVYYQWYSDQETTITLSDLSDIYYSPVILIELIQNDDIVDLTFKYSIIKIPKNPLKDH
jgi:hypothetical protein